MSSSAVLIGQVDRWACRMVSILDQLHIAITTIRMVILQ
jgi:hypothetical protein